MTELAFDPRTPLTEHRGLAVEMYGPEFLGPADGPVLNVAAGHTNLARDLEGTHLGVPEVVSLDPIYETVSWYTHDPNRVPGVAEDMPFADDTFATTLCQFGIQHINDPTKQAAALREMVRVTKPTDSINDNTKGTILVNPVWGVRKLTKAIYDHGLEDVCGIQEAPERVRGKHAYPTLVIKKIPALTAEKLDMLVNTVVHTGALNRRRTVAEFLARLDDYSKA